jgi:hypothetical protein
VNVTIFGCLLLAESGVSGLYKSNEKVFGAGSTIKTELALLVNKNKEIKAINKTEPVFVNLILEPQKVRTIQEHSGISQITGDLVDNIYFY